MIETYCCKDFLFAEIKRLKRNKKFNDLDAIIFFSSGNYMMLDGKKIEEAYVEFFQFTTIINI